MANFDGIIYEYGEPINGIVDQVYTPHVWYDQSKELNTGGKIFEELSIAESLFLGEAEDEVLTHEEILTELLQYLNLHIVQIGFDMYIFDWDTIRLQDSITWVDLFSNETKTQSINEINITANDASDSGTQITMADVYNQIIVTDETTSYDDVIVSPFDSDTLYSDYGGPQLVMTEFVAEGEGTGAKNVFYNMMTHYAEPDASYGKDSKSYFKDWYAQVMKNYNWVFKHNNVDCYSVCPHDSNGHYYDQWKFLKYLHDTNFASGILAFGGGIEQNEYNMTEVDNISSFKNTLIFTIHGNGANGKNLDGRNQTNVNPVIFPSDNDLKNMNSEISYKYSVEGNYSPAEEDVTNYLVFSGTIIYDKWVEKTGKNGFITTPIMIGRAEHTYYKALRQNNTFWDTKLWLWNSDEFINSNKFFTVPCKDNDDGMYYQQRFYKLHEYDRSGAGDSTEHLVENDELFITPYIDYGEKGKMYKYELGRYYDNDIIGLVPVFECQLKIGDKFLVETYDSNGNSIYTWTPEDELEYYVDDDAEHTVRYINTFRLGFNPKKDEYIIGQEHPIKNTVTTEMRLGSVSGTAIPIKKSDKLHGALEFKIIGPCNSWWDDGVYTHKTWFRHSSKSANSVPILSMVDSIKINDFNVQFISGNQSNQADTDNDIVYASDEAKQYINKKDDIVFRINTALTKDEADMMGVKTETHRSLVYDLTNETNILGITNNNTNETDKPEKHYVDAYFREYSKPRIIVDTNVHDDSKFSEFNRYYFNYFNGKQFYPIEKNYNLKMNKVSLKLKEM